jgi:hypothetical protein
MKVTMYPGLTVEEVALAAKGIGPVGFNRLDKVLPARLLMLLPMLDMEGILEDTKDSACDIRPDIGYPFY